jgi:hypothetical protein
MGGESGLEGSLVLHRIALEVEMQRVLHRGARRVEGPVNDYGERRGSAAATSKGLAGGFLQNYPTSFPSLWIPIQHPC